MGGALHGEQPDYDGYNPYHELRIFANAYSTAGTTATAREGKDGLSKTDCETMDVGENLK
jgi:hypothetical protein